MKIISFYTGKHISKLKEEDFIKAKSWLDNHFQFIDDRNFYSIEDLLKIFEKVDADGFLIDPINALDEPESGSMHQYNKRILKLVRHFAKNTGKTIEIVAHAVTEASRRLHTSGEFNGLVMPPMKSHTDGGQIFAGEPIELKFTEYGFSVNGKNPLHEYSGDMTEIIEDTIQPSGGMGNFKINEENEIPF